MQLYSVKTAMALESKALISYRVCAVLLNLFSSGRTWLVNKLHTVVVFLSVTNVESPERYYCNVVTSDQRFTFSSTVELESSILLTLHASSRSQKMDMLRNSQKLLLERLICYTLSGFSTTWKHGIMVRVSTLSNHNFVTY